MRPRENIEKIIKNFNVDVNPKKDQQIFDELKDVHANSQKSKHGISKIDIGRIIAESAMAKIAAAVIIIITVSLFLVQHEPPREIQTQQIAHTSKQPAELLTIGSLNLAYRYGGAEAVEEQSRKALGMVTVSNSNMKQLQIEYFRNDEI